MAQESSNTAGKENVLKVAWAAHKGAGQETGENALKFMHQLLPAGTFEISYRQPDIILFMSGGSERVAIEMIQPDHPVLLLSIRGNNAYAAATEVMAWTVNNSRPALLSDALDASETGLLDRWAQTVNAWNSLRGKKAGLIGSVSDWLVASDVPEEKLWKVFEVDLEVTPWNKLPNYSEMEPDTSLLTRFAGQNAVGLVDAARVLTLLRQTVEKKNLSAVAVECFSLVQQHRVTACLALAQLNSEGTVATCEGDLASMAGMMLIRAATGAVPWMANTTRVTDRTLILSHCTAAFDLVSDIKLDTHYETDSSLAVNGTVKASDVTVFRLSALLDEVFIAEGKVTGHPALENSCRTQTEIELPAMALALLRENPLGNHLLMAAGKYADLLRMVCFYKSISVL
jgi:L-fucose isomerase-like protein